MKAENLPGDLPEEVFTTLLQAGGLRVERIVSQGHASPPGFWYDQDESEWVIVVEGSASIEFQGQAEPVELCRGSYLNIPAHVRHRVAATDANQKTVWLAIHYAAPGSAKQPAPAGAWRAMVALGWVLLILGIIMFWPAGTIEWTKGWVFLAVFVGMIAVSIPYLWHVNPEIFAARSRIHKGTKRWDKILLVPLMLSFAAIFPIAALDNGRYGWSEVPVWLVAAGYVLYLLGFSGSMWAESVNKFAEPGVRIQTDRQQTVVDTGPYSIVRHPLYVASVLLFAGIPLALGSYWALIPAACAIVVLVVRTALEDRTLQNELPGYREYAGRVRYRLIYGVW